MKKYLIAISTTFFLLSACSDDDYSSINVDPVNPSEVPAGFLFANATKSLFDQLGSTSVNRNVFRLFAQYWTETQYTTETNYQIGNRALPDAHWGILYRDVLFDLKNAKHSVENNNDLFDNEKANQMAIIEIVEVYTWQQMVDTFGNIPYTEALMGSENETPAYDDAATIYQDLVAKIRNAYASIDESVGGFGDQDIIYNDDISAWKKLASTMKLKIAMRLADADPALSKTLAEEAVSEGVFTSNDDDFKLNYEPNNVNANPMYADLVLSGRQDFIPANTYVDYMNELEDPRRSVFFDENLGAGVYEGGIYGSLNNYSLYTHIGPLFFTQDLPVVLLDYSEVKFWLAEAVERGYAVGGTAEAHYTEAITANMEFWEIDPAEISTYLARTDVAYATAGGTWKEKIGKQFWIAMYNRGFEGWSAWRMYDAPTLNLPAETNADVPVRFTYPAEEATLNATNYQAASSAIGGDDLNTKLFWDVN